MTQATPPAATDFAAQPPVVARAARWYRATRYIMVVVVIGCGGLFIKDGFWTWPQEQQENEEALKHDKKPPHSMHTEADLLLQKGLGISLPPLGLLLLCWFLYNSRGAYRLNGTTLSIPGHAPVDLSQITRLDNALWDKKGIAYLYYPTPSGGGEGRMRLDDFIYDRKPTDEIYHRVEAYFTGNAVADDAPVS